MLTLGITTFALGVVIGWCMSAVFAANDTKNKPTGKEFADEHEII